MPEERTVRAIEIHIVSPTYLSVMVWPDHITDTLCIRLITKSLNWLTARAGEPVQIRHSGQRLWTKYTIKGIKLTGRSRLSIAIGSLRALKTGCMALAESAVSQLAAC